MKLIEKGTRLNYEVCKSFRTGIKDGSSKTSITKTIKETPHNTAAHLAVPFPPVI